MTIQSYGRNIEESRITGRTYTGSWRFSDDSGHTLANLTLLETKYHEKAIGSWNSPQIKIISLDGKAIARIPYAFLARGGDNTWSYILHVVQQLVR